MPPPSSVGSVGFRAQVASSAELAVAVRQSTPDVGAVTRGLAERTLIKTWAMRGTLHVLRPSDAASFLSLIASARTWEKPAWQRAFGAAPEEIEALVAAVSELLDGTVLTRDDLVTRIVANEEFATMEVQLRSGWGALLKPLAWQGALCHGPSQASKVTFTRPDTLVSDWPGIPDPDEAAPAAIAAYLGAYGPSTPEVFDAWLSRGALKKKTVRGWFATMEDQLATVEVEGQVAFILSEHVEDLAAVKPGRSVRLLGAFDQYVLGPGTNDPQILPAEHRGEVSKAAGWISPIVVVRGRIVGVWDLKDDEVTVALFAGATAPPFEALEAEVAHLARATGRNRLALRVAQ